VTASTERAALSLWFNAALPPHGKAPLVEKINTFHILALGIYVQKLHGIFPADPIAPIYWRDAIIAVVVARANIGSFLAENPLDLEAALDAGNDLLATLTKCSEMGDPELRKSDAMPPVLVAELKVAVDSFQATLLRELPRRPTYIVQKKGGFREHSLVDRGEELFPAELVSKVPDAIPDIKQGTRCIAFDLPTAAGYHLHRANEAVLRVYYDAVTGGAPRPKDRSIGSYLREMDSRGAGTTDMKETIRNIAKFHRNPLIHPEHSLKDVNEAIALLNNIHTAMVGMLREIP
jgi:hypothetical protein